MFYLTHILFFTSILNYIKLFPFVGETENKTSNVIQIARGVSLSVD